MLAGNDVYVADRQADRIQVFTKQGKFLREFSVAPETLGDGSAVGVALTKDGQQPVRRRSHEQRGVARGIGVPKK
jgi:hypothetical protein